MVKPKISKTALSRIWQGDGYRLFLSHKSEVKRKTCKLKDELGLYGVAAFVAHADIEATRAWQDEIERALYSMDALAALMTEKFHESHWTDQEVGFALGRSVPVLSVNLGRTPYGFLGRIQALTTTWETAAMDIVKILIGREATMFDAYLQAIRTCGEYEDGNKLAEVLPALKNLEDDEIQQLVDAYNSNS